MSVLFLCFILLLFSFRSQYRCPRRGGTWQRYSHQPPYGLASHRLLHEAIGHSYRCSLYPSLRRRRRRSDSSLPRLRAGRGKHGKLAEVVALQDVGAGRGMRVSEVMMEVGFTSSSYFAKCFKNQFGVLPKAFVQQNGPAPGGA